MTETIVDTSDGLAPHHPSTDAGAAFRSSCAPCGSRHEDRWRCAWTHPHEERRAHIELSHQGYAAFLPFVLYRGRIVVAFPRYLFVRLQVLPWQPILSTRGIAGVICHGPGLPTPLPPGAVDKLIARTSGRGVVDDEDEDAPDQPRSRWHGLSRMTAGERTRLLVRLFGERVALAA